MNITTTKNVDNNVTHNIAKNTLHLIMNIWETLKYYSSTNYISNNYKSQTAYVDNNSHKGSDNITFDIANNISKNINQYATDAANNYKTNKVSNLKKSCNFTDDVVVHEHNAIHTNDSRTVTKINKLVNSMTIITLQRKQSIQII